MHTGPDTHSGRRPGAEITDAKSQLSRQTRNVPEALCTKAEQHTVTPSEGASQRQQGLSGANDQRTALLSTPMGGKQFTQVPSHAIDRRHRAIAEI